MSHFAIMTDIWMRLYNNQHRTASELNMRSVLLQHRYIQIN